MVLPGTFTDTLTQRGPLPYIHTRTSIHPVNVLPSIVGVIDTKRMPSRFIVLDFFLSAAANPTILPYFFCGLHRERRRPTGWWKTNVISSFFLSLPLIVFFLSVAAVDYDLHSPQMCKQSSASNGASAKMFPFGYAITGTQRSALEEAYNRKKEYLNDRVAALYASTNPASLWSAIVKYRVVTGKDGGAAVDTYDDLLLTYEGYRSMVYDVLFHVTPDEDAAADTQAREWRRTVYFHHPFLSPATFLAFARSSHDAVPAAPLYAFAAKRLLLFRIRVELELDASAPPPIFLDRAQRAVGGRLPCPPSASSPLSNGLTQEDIEMFISDLVPNLRLVRDMPPWMLPYYLCHASRKFMFMCDTRSVGAIPIDTFMKSEVFSELLRMFESDAQDAIITYPKGTVVEIPAKFASTAADDDDTVAALVLAYEGDGNALSDVYQMQLLDGEAKVQVPREQIYWSTASMDYVPTEMLSMDNWFSLALMSRIYEHFTALDADGDGVLTREELSHYSNDSFTQLSIQRVFECHVNHSGGRHIMDYKTYLNFVIATEHAATRPAMRYIWALLDLDGTKTYIKIATLHCFCKEIANELLANGLMVDISAQSILSEIVDMINPAWHEWVTFEDIERSGHQATVLPVLLSYRNFYAYDCREQTAASANDEYADIPEK
ncbi:hypothetical protein, conserved [Leishmania tarentolae]|uniref:EF-hand domain-containing protein n=1 Tax=Leishmania tarentolae TaxID=5689 RepID=A0A640KQP7_LEITA|nr:hypothetical protein, conserved [Leishmania tarentolae]